jgi:hypothetical protein
MAKRNREKLMEKSMYDFLCMMNANLRTRFGSACVMGALPTEYSEYDRIMRCQKHEADCEKCLQSWLNEFPF